MSSLTERQNIHLDLGGYVLDRLGPEERARFEEHLATCVHCQEEHRQLSGVAELLQLAASAEQPPPEVEQRVFAAIERDVGSPFVKRAWPPRLRPALTLAGSIAVAAVAFVVGTQVRGDGQEGVLEVDTTLVADEGPASATVEVWRIGIGRVVSLRSGSLPILPKGEFYEVWFIGPGDSPARPNRISAGTFHPDEGGRSVVELTAAVDPLEYRVISVTAEPGDGDPRATGPEVLRSSS